MRILQLTKYFPPAIGGIESFAGDLSRAFVAQGHKNMVLAHRSAPDEPAEVLEGAGHIIRVPSFGELLYAPVAPSYPLHLRRCIRDFRPDMVLVHMPNVSEFWTLLQRITCPVIVFWHADVVFPREKRLHRLAYLGYALFERALLRKAEKIIATSPPYLESSIPLQPFRDKCTVIPLGIDQGRILAPTAQEVSAVKKRILHDEQARYVYAAGRFAHYKGFDTLIRAAAKTRNEHPELKYVIAGNGETRPAILRQLMELGLESQVFLPGKVSDSDYWALMKGCELFCLPSLDRSEAFGVVLIEAMAMGKPCIASDIPGSGTGWVARLSPANRTIQCGREAELVQAIIQTLGKKNKADVVPEALQGLDIHSVAGRILDQSMRSETGKPKTRID